jgi:tRNA G18 (ribose-2'-O)-methylase SpoU
MQRGGRIMDPLMRGYFGIGVEGISKPANLGALMRTAHAFGASFVFTIGAAFDAKRAADADTAASHESVPLHVHPDLAQFALPEGCRLVGLELTEDAIDMPSFRHPPRAAYVLGAERASLSPALIERCDFVVRIPGRFCVNLAVAGAIAMYDRMISLGRFAERPVRTGGPTAARPAHRHGDPLWQRKKKARAKAPG